LKYFSGITGDYQPSLCDYYRGPWIGGGANLILAKSEILINHIQTLTDNKYIGLRQFLGPNYSWDELMGVNSILVIPYNISTMSLFEMATAGLPILVPSRKFIKELRTEFDGVLSELSFLEMRNLDVTGLSSDNPNNYRSSEYLDWWMDRADFFDLELMPNVTVIDSFEELKFTRDSYQDESYRTIIRNRNESLFKSREEKYISFRGKL
jgi:hypothetical protein